MTISFWDGDPRTGGRRIPGEVTRAPDGTITFRPTPPPAVNRPITAERLRAGADAANDLHVLLNQCLTEGVLYLVGFDLDYLADQFNAAATKLEQP